METVEKRREKLWEALAKYGITSEAELNREISKMQPLNIACMVFPVNVTKEPNDSATREEDE